MHQKRLGLVYTGDTKSHMEVLLYLWKFWGGQSLLSRGQFEVRGGVEGGESRHQVVETRERDEIHRDLIQIHI